MRALFVTLILVMWSGMAVAQGLSALARLDPDRSGVDGTEITLTISQPVPYRVFTLDAPRRLVVDFREVDFSRLSAPAFVNEMITDARGGRIQQGWTRLVLDLSGPYSVASAGMATGAPDGTAKVTITLEETSAEAFSKVARAGPSRAFPTVTSRPALRPVPKTGPLKIVLDPGHGGIDPGAIHNGVNEADLVLTFSRELKEALIRQGGFAVELTRDTDEFVSLEGRIALAKRAGADVFLSIHADAVSEGIARGAQIFTLAEEASSEALRLLAERHDRGDLLAGVDLNGQADEVALVLMSIARTETQPRTDALARSLADGLTGAGVLMHKRPLEQGAFSVLKSPDLPAALIEIGFMSSPQELEKLMSPDWRQKAVAGIVAGVKDWARKDAATRALIRQ